MRSLTNLILISLFTSVIAIIPSPASAACPTCEGTSTTLGSTGVEPFGIAIDSAGNIYTANDGSNTVTKITPAGVATTLGSTELNPRGIVIDSTGNIYTANYGSNTVTKISPAGISTTLGPTGQAPISIAIDAAGNIYTANYDNDNVTKIEPNGDVTNFDLGGTGRNPRAITVDTAGNIYTANNDSSNVTKITSAGVATTHGITGLNPQGIVADPAGNVYTANYGSNTVTKITTMGVSTTLGTTGEDPLAITIDSAGNIYTANNDSNNVSKITPSGSSTLFGETGLWPLAIAIDAVGNIYTADWGANTVTKIVPPLANPAFTLSQTSETARVGTAVSGYTITSTGGAIATYSISPAISNSPGLSFSTATGLISGSPSSSTSTVNYTITATNATGTATRTFALTINAATPPVVYVPPTPVPYLNTLSRPKMHLSSDKLICMSGIYNAGFTLDGIIQGSSTTLFTPASFRYTLHINGIPQTTFAITTSSVTTSWNSNVAPAESLVSCSVTVSFQSLTNVDKSTDNPSEITQALIAQRKSIETATAEYYVSLSANLKAYQKALVDNRAKWRGDIEKIRTNFYLERDRIRSLPSTKATRALTSVALKTYTAAQKKAAADYKASEPAAAKDRDSSNQAALDAKSAAIAKANSIYGIFIESIGYGVLIP